MVNLQTCPQISLGLGFQFFKRFFSPKEKERIKWCPSTPVYLQPLRSSLDRILLPVSCVASVRSMPCMWQCIQSMRHIPFSLALSLTIWISLQISAYWPFFILPMSTFCCSLMFLTSPLLLSLCFLSFTMTNNAVMTILTHISFYWNEYLCT